MHTITKNIIITIFSLIPALLMAQSAENIFQASGTPANPKVEISWNRYYSYDGVEEICRKLANAHPNLIKLSSIGKSYEGRELWMMTVSDHQTGEVDRKPGFYVDGNIHSNEIQGTEITLYTAWYLAEMFASNKFIKELLQDKVFYIVPTINPDARDNYLKEPNTPHSPRSGMLVLDNDRDGDYGEDGFQDLNNDGHITMMRRKTPYGQYKEDPNDPRRLIQVDDEEFGEYEILGYEGIDKDSDGLVNEDGIGYYDPNRDWGWKWQPDYIQRGAYKYPFSLPENRAVADFVLKHPNIAGAQSYHNNGGMILRGPGAEEDKDTYNREDVKVYDALGKRGQKMMPGYRYLTVYKDLYSVFGGELDWFYGGRGIFTFTNELFTSYMYFNENAGRNSGQEYEFDKYLLFGDAFVEWETYDHPQYGEIEIGGFKKNYTRADPGFLLEQDAHRNMAFTIFHAYHTPKLVVAKVEEKELPGGLREITAEIANERLIPTHGSHDLTYKIERPDFISLKGLEVLAGMVVENQDMGITKEQKVKPEQIKVDNIPGMGTVKVRWIVKGKGKYTIEVDSNKGGMVSYNP